ncbi:MAG: sulfotransferase [Anaerolineales bacterium]|nr:sulfotransferase [Anaerolineales bacterium]
MSISSRISQALHILFARSPQKIDRGQPGSAGREIPPISAEEVAEARQFFPLDKFFIFGHARSGTTMLTRLVRLHPEVHCNYQAHFFTRPPLLQSLVRDNEVGAWLSRGSNRWNRGKDLSPVVLRAAADFILERDARQLGKRIVGDKSPSSLLDGEAVRLMHQVYPDGRLIYIVRDGRDTAISHRFQAFIDFPDQLLPEDLRIREEFSRQPEPFLHGERSIFTEKGLRRAAEGWVRNVTQTHQQGQQLFGEQYFSLRYEDMLRNPWEELTRLWSFLGASLPTAELHEALNAEMAQNPDADWQQQKAKEIALPLQKGKQGGWRDLFTAHDREIYHQIASQTLQAWGYPVQ